jgi:hypothetical protein
MPTATTYLLPAMVRQLSHELTVALISDADLDALATAYADPEIDGSLAGFGAPFGYTAPPTMIRIISALLTTAAAFDDIFSRTADESRFASAKRAEARKLIDRIQTGKLSLGIVADDPLIEVSEDDQEDRPSIEVFVGDELDWQRPAEARGL